MARRRLRVKFRIPAYATPRIRWRRKIHRVAREAVKAAGVKYEKKDKLELNIRIYLEPPALHMHDVDNRLKDIMDALQGRVGGHNLGRPWGRIIENDNQIYKVTIEKQIPSRQSHGQGHVVIRRYRPSRGTAR